MRIDRDAAVDAIARWMAKPLAIEGIRAAWGIHEVINEDVARAFRVHASERGIDLRGCSMIAFGGSGPLHAVRVARKLKITQVIMPPCAGVMSAFGMLVSPLSFEVVRSSRAALASLDGDGLRRRFGAIAEEAIEVLVSSGVPPNQIEITRSLDMRYVGQGYEIDVVLPPLANPAELLDDLTTLFTRAYRRQFGIDLPGKVIEIVNWRVEATARTMLQVGVEHVGRYAPGKRPQKGTRPAYDPESGTFVAHAVYDRYQLAPDTEIEGPALVEEIESTSVIGAGTTARVDHGLNLVVALARSAT
jgi:N-methylhydantoinase A